MINRSAAALLVPETIVTNDPAGVRSFISRIKGRIVVKTLSTPAVLEDGGVTLAHTRRLSTEDLADLSGVDVTAHLFQEWIDKAYEVRLTAVGRRLFAGVADFKAATLLQPVRTGARTSTGSRTGW